MKLWILKPSLKKSSSIFSFVCFIEGISLHEKKNKEDICTLLFRLVKLILSILKTHLNCWALIQCHWTWGCFFQLSVWEQVIQNKSINLHLWLWTYFEGVSVDLFALSFLDSCLSNELFNPMLMRSYPSMKKIKSKNECWVFT